MTAALFTFADGARQAAGLASECGVPVNQIDVHRFPDGESLVRVDGSAETALLFRSLDDPNAKLVEVLLAASALRDGGAKRVILIAPYLAYMRQDVPFHGGEAVSQRVIGKLLAAWFDGLVTVDPHLHRIASLDAIMGGIPALAVSAAPALVQAIASDLDSRTIMVGPDSESRPWVESIARPLGLDVLVGEKIRKGDREVVLTVPDFARASGRPAILVDDLISSGTTLMACASLLRDAGATKVEAIATHSLASGADLDRLTVAGIARLRATDSTSNAIASIPLAGVLGEAIRKQGWLK
ncbi:MAG: ribose-phosphate diphosphokinase [Sphingomonadales bacterium]|nr:ribose-phosphate diphosphokinase [Sphingomonadales bacterium]MBU3993191.1 ribose-phosphate diphosphokinase [Alphaproteobacteria bacterium]